MPLIIGKNRYHYTLWFMHERIIHNLVEQNFKPIATMDSIKEAKFHGCKRLEVDKRVSNRTKAFKIVKLFEPEYYFKTRVYGMALNSILDYDYDITTEDKWGKIINVGESCCWIEYMRVKKETDLSREDIRRAVICRRILINRGKFKRNGTDWKM